MRECLGALVVVKRELSGVGPGRVEIITVCPFHAYAVRLCVPAAEKLIFYYQEIIAQTQAFVQEPAPGGCPVDTFRYLIYNKIHSKDKGA